MGPMCILMCGSHAVNQLLFVAATCCFSALSLLADQRRPPAGKLFALHSRRACQRVTAQVERTGEGVALEAVAEAAWCAHAFLVWSAFLVPLHAPRAARPLAAPITAGGPRVGAGGDAAAAAPARIFWFEWARVNAWTPGQGHALPECTVH